MDQVNKNLLQKNTKDWAIYSILNNTKTNNKIVVGWKMIAGTKHRVEVIFHIIKKYRSELVVRPFDLSEKERLIKLASGTEKLNFYLPDEMVLFQTEVKQIEMSGDIIVEIPKMIAQVERRKDFRLFVEGNLNIEVNFTKANHSQKVATQFFKKSCYDISSGGAAFIASKTESKFFKPDDIIEKIELDVEDRKLMVRAKVVQLKKLDKKNSDSIIYGDFIVSLEFLSLNEKDKEFLKEFVFKYTEFQDVI